MIKELEPLLTLKEIQVVTHISENTLQNTKWRLKNGIPIIKVGGKLCAIPSRLKKWLDDLHG